MSGKSLLVADILRAVHGSAPPGSITDREFPGHPTDYWLLKNDSAPWHHEHHAYLCVRTTVQKNI
jgi:hypothetical protein